MILRYSKDMSWKYMFSYNNSEESGFFGVGIPSVKCAEQTLSLEHGDHLTLFGLTRFIDFTHVDLFSEFLSLLGKQ